MAVEALQVGINKKEDRGSQAKGNAAEQVIRKHGVDASLLEDTFPVIVSMDGNVVLVAPGFDTKAAGSLLVKKGSPFGELTSEGSVYYQPDFKYRKCL